MSLLLASTWAISSYLNENDQSRLKDILLSGLSSDDVGIIDHSVRVLNLLGAQIPNKDQICKQLVTENQNVEAVFHAAKVSSVLGCSLQVSAGVREKLESALTASSVSEIFFSTGALSALGTKVEAPKVVKALNAALKKDDSIASLGQAFQIAATLEGDVSSVFGRIEDAIVQADQVNILNLLLQVNYLVLNPSCCFRLMVKCCSLKEV